MASIPFVMVVCVQAQNFSKNAIGLRQENNDGFGTEISYQARLSQKNRLELDLGWRSNNNEDNFGPDVALRVRYIF